MNRQCAVMACLVTIAGAVAGCNRADPGGPAVVREDFEGGAYERRLWELQRDAPSGLRSDMSAGELRWMIPPGSSDRSAIVRGRFAVEGDFDVRARYRIETLPMPREGWSNVEIFISGADGDAAVIRTNHAIEKAGYSLWFEPAEGRDASGSWSHTRTRDNAGSLVLRRSGRLLEFASGVEGELQQIGAVDYGDGAIDRIEIRVLAAPSDSPAVVAFDDITVEADRIIEPDPPTASGPGVQAWAWGGLGTTAVVALGVAWFIRRRV